MIKKAEKPVENVDPSESIIQSIEVTKDKLDKAFLKKSKLEMEIDSFILSIRLMEEELAKYGS